MALADYKLCDLCDAKAFYDSNLSYEPSRKKLDPNAFRQVGETVEWGQTLGYLGDWAVLCTDCSKTHKTAIVPIDGRPSARTA